MLYFKLHKKFKILVIKMTLNIVMVEPEIPQNTGNVARTCAATGARLHLVGKMGFTPDDKKLKRAGLDYWYLLDITYYDSLEEFFEKNQGGNFFYFSTKAQKRHSDVKYPDNTYLVFGKETAGLPEKLLFENGINWEEWLETKKKQPNICLNCGKELTGKYRFIYKFCNHKYLHF